MILLSDSQGAKGWVGESRPQPQPRDWEVTEPGSHAQGFLSTRTGLWWPQALEGKGNTSSQTQPTRWVAGWGPEGVWTALALPSHWVRVSASLPASYVCNLGKVSELVNLEPQSLHLKRRVVMPARQDRLGVEYPLLRKAFPGQPSKMHFLLLLPQVAPTLVT